MKYEPPVDHARVISTVRASYGIAITQLVFVPLGFAAVCYIAHTADGNKRFIKLWPHAGSSVAARHEATLRLTRELYQRGLFTELPFPLSTHDGKLLTRFGRTSIAVFPFLPGSEPPAPMPIELQREWAQAIARIHQATPAVGDLLPARETFSIPFEYTLRRALARLATIGAHERPGLLALRDLLLPRAYEIEQQLAQLYRLRTVVERLRGPLVLCHTDAGGQNLLLDGKRLYVLDWDDALLAPPEHDLHEARFMDLGHVLEVYIAAGGAQPLAIEHFAFYLLRRHLGDMAARVLRMLAAEAPAAEDQHALDGIQAWGFDQWRALPQTLHTLQAALDALA